MVLVYGKTIQNFVDSLKWQTMSMTLRFGKNPLRPTNKRDSYRVSFSLLQKVKKQSRFEPDLAVNAVKL